MMILHKKQCRSLILCIFNVVLTNFWNMHADVSFVRVMVTQSLSKWEFLDMCCTSK